MGEGMIELRIISVPTDSPHMRAIVSSRPIEGTKAGYYFRLACGHEVSGFGDRERLEKTGVWCLACAEEDAARKARDN